MGIGGINAAKVITNSKMDLFSRNETNLGTNKKALNVDKA